MYFIDILKKLIRMKNCTSNMHVITTIFAHFAFPEELKNIKCYISNSKYQERRVVWCIGADAPPKKILPKIFQLWFWYNLGITLLFRLWKFSFSLSGRILCFEQKNQVNAKLSKHQRTKSKCAIQNTLT